MLQKSKQIDLMAKNLGNLPVHFKQTLEYWKLRIIVESEEKKDNADMRVDG